MMMDDANQEEVDALVRSVYAGNTPVFAGSAQQLEDHWGRFFYRPQTSELCFWYDSPEDEEDEMPYGDVIYLFRVTSNAEDLREKPIYFLWCGEMGGQSSFPYSVGGPYREAGEIAEWVKRESARFEECVFELQKTENPSDRAFCESIEAVRRA